MKNFRKITCWAARILAILYALFISIFALDVFQEGYSASETILALAIHLVPTAVVLVCLAVAWKTVRAGGLLFLLLGAAFWVFFGREAEWINFLIIPGPLILVGALFLACSYLKEPPGGKPD